MTGIFGVGSIRPSQLVSTFGPGSIYDNLDDSFLIMGTDSWNERNCKKLTDETLLHYLKKSDPRRYASLIKFMVPISSNESDEQVAIRTFPKWGVCPECNMLQRRNYTGIGLKCRSTTCRGIDGTGRQPHTIPVRFIAACINGHLDDFPWYHWVHRGTVDNCNENDARLYLEDGRHSSSLESKTVRCTNCDRNENMVMSLSSNGLRFILPGGCRGRRPWLTTDDPVPCVDANDEPVFLQGVYKGATNVYFPKTVRSITIPPFAGPQAERVIEKIEGTTLLTQTREKLLNVWIPELFPEDDPMEILQIIDVLREKRTTSESPSIRADEFAALNLKKFPNNGIDKGNFKTEPIELPTGFSDHLDNLVLIRKLREIVAMTGFYRLEPFGYSSNDLRMISPVTNFPEELPRWLPAVENNGEGIFFSFKNDVISNWADTPKVTQRFNEIISNNPNPISSSDVEISQKYIFLHTLSHLVIKEIANYAGYSVSSLRERIYCDDNMAGILIYTSSPSSDGSLGGLVEQGKKPKFNIILQKALRKSRLCSMEPLCSFARLGTGNKTNGSACHACLYLPETSCESMNNLLDRAFVQNTLSGEIGLFAQF